jgi:hypothetical protein
MMNRDRAVCIHAHFYQPPRYVRPKTRRPVFVIPAEHKP